MKRTAERRAVDLLVRFHLGRRRPAQPRHPARRKDYELTRGWGWRENILGFGISEKRVEGERQRGVKCLTVFVKRKMPRHRVPEGERVPPILRLESTGDEVVTDLVVLSGSPRAEASSGARFRPVQPGAGVGHFQGIAGTLGLLVRQNDAPAALGLSCSHVLARSGNGAAPGDLIEQPLVPDADNRVGSLIDGFTVLSDSGTFDEDVAFMAFVAPPLAQMADSGLAVSSCSALAADQFDVGMAITRDGVGTGPQAGETVAFQTAWSQVDMPFVGAVTLTSLVAGSLPHDAGDSGAAVLDANNTVVGIHVAGIPGEDVSLFQPIGPIMNRHNLRLFTG